MEFDSSWLGGQPVVAEVVRLTGYGLDQASRAVQEVAYSVSVQHGQATRLLQQAIRQTDGTLRRADAGYERALIDRIYSLRAEYVARLAERARTENRTGDARAVRTIVTLRYPTERENALEMSPLPGA